MEYRIFDTIVNVDKITTEKQRRFVMMIANLTELMFSSDEVFMDLTMMKMSHLANMVKEEMTKKCQNKLKEIGESEDESLDRPI